MRRLTNTIIALGLLAALFAAACGPAAESGGGGGPAAKKDGKITIGYTAIGAAYSDLYTCQDYGVFKKNGLNAEVTKLNTSSQLLAALSSGSVDIGTGTASSTAVGAMKGVDLRYIALPAPRFYVEMWGDKDIRSPEDLRGRKVAVSSPGSLSDEALRTLIQDKGLGDSVKVTYLKAIPAEITALEQGAVDAIVTQPPNATKTGRKGFHKILDFTEYPFASNTYTVTANFLEQNRDAVAKFVKSEVECLAILDKQRAKTIASIRKHSGTDDQQLAEYSYKFFKPIWTRDPKVDPVLIEDAFRRAAAKEDMKPPSDVSKYIDNSFLTELRSSGFTGSLYK
jgi:NitT/TauT family transport system substrate-binding protein